jgi:osmotically-inducible protein OsmY
MVTNHISPANHLSVNGTKDRVQAALVQNAHVNADSVTVHVIGTKVTLSGEVRSWVEQQQAGRAAWSSPSVTDVENRLYVHTY